MLLGNMIARPASSVPPDFLKKLAEAEELVCGGQFHFHFLHLTIFKQFLILYPSLTLLNPSLVASSLICAYQTFIVFPQIFTLVIENVLLLSCSQLIFVNVNLASSSAGANVAEAERSTTGGALGVARLDGEDAGEEQSDEVSRLQPSHQVIFMIIGEAPQHT